MHLNKISNESNNDTLFSDSAMKLLPIRNYRSIDMILIDFKPNNNPKNQLQSVPMYFDQGNRLN